MRYYCNKYNKPIEFKTKCSKCKHLIDMPDIWISL